LGWFIVVVVFGHWLGGNLVLIGKTDWFDWSVNVSWKHSTKV